MKERKGVALEYSGDLPKIIASARGILAEKLLDIAREYGITVYHEPDLAETLSQFDRGTEIPEQLFAAVAEVLAYCYRVNADFKRKIDSMGANDG